MLSRACGPPRPVYSAASPYTAWSANVMVNDVASISDFIFIGDYTDVTLTNGTADAFAIWTDRRHQTGIFQFEDNRLADHH